MILLSLIALPDRWLLVAIDVLVVGYGQYEFRHTQLPRFRAWLLQLRFTDYNDRVIRWIKLQAFVTFLVLVVELLYGAHPQRLYDQLNYHLVLVRKILFLRQPIAWSFDSPIFISGPIEYGITWVAAVNPTDPFIISVGQTIIFVSIFPTLVGAFLIVMQKISPTIPSIQTLLLAAMVPLALVPNDEILRIAKPDAFLLGGTAVLLAFFVVSGIRYFWVICALATAILGIKITFLHAVVGFIPLILSSGKVTWGRIERYWIPVLIGIFVFAANALRSYVYTGTPLYPGDSIFFDSEFADSTTRAFWKFVSQGHQQHFYESWMGFCYLIRRSYGLMTFLPILGILFLFSQCQSLKSQKYWLAPIVSFLATYLLIWPVFYQGNTYSRFVSPASAGLLILSIGLLAGLVGRLRSVGTLLLFALMLAASNLEVEFLKIYRWNQGTAEGALQSQTPMVEVAKFVNSRSHSARDLILVDDALVYFYNMRTLYLSLTPREHRIWDGLLSSPEAMAKEQQLLAIVRNKASAGDPWAMDGLSVTGPIDQVWDKFVNRGDVFEVDDYQILIIKRDTLQ
jgi:hypothetical protein